MFAPARCAYLACDSLSLMVLLCDNVANVGPLAIGPLAGGADRGPVAFALRCRCLRARSGPADGCRGRGRRCRSRFQRSAAHADDAPTLQASSIPPARKSRRTSLAARTARTARLARAGNQASSLLPARKSRRTSLSARTPRMGRKTTRTSVPRFLIRSPRFRTRSRRFLRWWWRRFLWRWRRFRMWWRRFLMWRRCLWWCGSDMLRSVAGAAVPLAQLQSDLFYFLLGIAGGRQFLMSPRWFRTCSARLPVRPSCSRNCPPTFFPSCWASPGRSP